MPTILDGGPERLHGVGQRTALQRCLPLRAAMDRLLHYHQSLTGNGDVRAPAIAPVQGGPHKFPVLLLMLCIVHDIYIYVHNVRSHLAEAALKAQVPAWARAAPTCVSFVAIQTMSRTYADLINYSMTARA